MMADEYQAVIIVLSDGRRGTFTGKLLCRPDNEAGPDAARIVRVLFSEPKDLPPGCYFEEVRDGPSE